MIVILFFTVLGFLLFLPLIKTLSRDDKMNIPTQPKETEGVVDVMQEFKDAYLWASGVFGVNRCVYQRMTQEDQKHIEYFGVRYFTTYYVNKYPHMYSPLYRLSNCELPDIIRYGVGDEIFENQCEEFELWFIGVVNEMKQAVDGEDIALFAKYGIGYKKLLTSKFEVDTMALFSIEHN